MAVGCYDQCWLEHSKQTHVARGKSTLGASLAVGIAQMSMRLATSKPGYITPNSLPGMVRWCSSTWGQWSGYPPTSDTQLSTGTLPQNTAAPETCKSIVVWEQDNYRTTQYSESNLVAILGTSESTLISEVASFQGTHFGIFIKGGHISGILIRGSSL